MSDSTSPLRSFILPFRQTSPPGGGGPAPCALTVRAVIEQFLNAKRAEHRAGAIQAKYLARLEAHLADLADYVPDGTPEGARVGELPVVELRASVARQWLCDHAEWKSPHTLEGAYRSLRSLGVWAEDEELIPRNPLRKLKRFWPPPQPRGACKPEEYEALMRVARACSGKRSRTQVRARPSRTRFRFQLWFLWETGCRTCELRAALWEQVDWERGLLVLDDNKTKRATGRGRVIPLSPKVVRVLRWLWRRRLPGQKYIFVAQGGRPLAKSSWNRRFREYARLAGVRESVTLYTLRHGFCVEGLQAGVGDQELATIMGHTTTRYIAWYGRDLRDRTDHLRQVAAKVHDRKKPVARRKPATPDAGQRTLWDEA